MQRAIFTVSSKLLGLEQETYAVSRGILKNDVQGFCRLDKAKVFDNICVL